MKRLLWGLLLTVGFTFNAQAYINEDSSWDEILSTINIEVADPLGVMSDYANPEGFLNSCLVDGAIRTINPVSYCAEYREWETNPRRGRESECVRYGKRHLALPLVYEAKRCVNWEDLGPRRGLGECIEWKTQTFTRPTDYQIKVFRKIGNNNKSVIFTKAFAVPGC
ncbi:MAG: hypothetical protein H6624_13585 [Bdellovibrionaceae bacterium]|nr:hypothetical protein [Bdellovibrionales bacterium]MCB9085375.1 hypothetical protein [Pseudobdellovibrionaceae bacterium]